MEETTTKAVRPLGRLFFINRDGTFSTPNHNGLLVSLPGDRAFKTANGNRVYVLVLERGNVPVATRFETVGGFQVVGLSINEALLEATLLLLDRGEYEAFHLAQDLLRQVDDIEYRVLIRMREEV